MNRKQSEGNARKESQVSIFWQVIETIEAESHDEELDVLVLVLPNYHVLWFTWNLISFLISV